jgi:hypothetical protein
MLRLEDDERLDTLLDQLQKKAPSVPAAAAGKDARGRRPRRHGDDGGSSQAGGEGDAGDDDASATMSSGIHSVKSQLAAEMRAVRRQLDELDARAGAKAERAGVAPRAANYGRLARGFGT